MILYSQKDNSWKNQRLGTCNGETIAKSGCKITCYAMLDGRNPSVIDNLLTDNKVYVSGCLTNDEACAKFLGLEYNGKTTVKPSYTCIAETNYYKKYGVPQHFFIIRPDGMIADPLSNPCVWRKNTYPIVSYRLIKEKITPKEEPMQYRLDSKEKELLDNLDISLGDNIDTQDIEPLIERLAKFYNREEIYKETLRKQIKDAQGSIREKNAYLEEEMKKTKELTEELDSCENQLKSYITADAQDDKELTYRYQDCIDRLNKVSEKYEQVVKENKALRAKAPTVSEAITVLLNAIKKALNK